MSNISLSDYSDNSLNKSLFGQEEPSFSAEQCESRIEDNFKKGVIPEELYKQAKEVLQKTKALKKEEATTEG